MGRQHPWFTMHLPRYLAVMHSDTIASATAVDEELVREVEALGFDRNFLIESIRTRQQNKVTHLLHALSTV